MKSRTAGTLSGCIVWIVVVGFLSSCLLPVFIVIGSVTSFSQFAIKITGNFICPDGTTPESHTFETTSTDEYGNTIPATGVELHCIDQSGTIVKNDPVVYAFLWVGIFAGIGLIIAGILAFALAAPAGVLIGRLLDRKRKPDLEANIEPQ